MPTLDWIGKKAVENHHKEVPYRLLKCVPELSVGEPGSGNLLVQGDNLEALKALLPYYGGKVKCIYIDPPYNTGDENWVYNDAVNSPEMRQWLGDVVGRDDLSRHDKWLCMMLPRLKILKEFLSPDGIIAVSIDDNEICSLGIILDDIFGPENLLARAPWLAEPSGGKDKSALRKGHEYLLIYCNGERTNLSREEISHGDLDKKDRFGKYRKGRELLKWGAQSLRKDRENMWFSLTAPDGRKVWPIRNDGKEGRWRMGKDNEYMQSVILDCENAHWEMRPYDSNISHEGRTERWVPYQKIRDKKRAFGWNTWLDSYGFNADATRELKDVFGDKLFDTPKPTALIQWVISLHTDENAIVLDSFAGSGTTAHSVLKCNSEDGGNRRFILVEMIPGVARDIARRRIENVIRGYKSPNGERIEGLGGAFSYCELGQELFESSGSIRNEVKFAELAHHVFFTEMREPLPKVSKGNSPLLGVANGTAVYLLYNGILRDKDPKRGNVLTMETLKWLPAHDGPKVVYGTACTLGARTLARHGITFRQIPYEVRAS